MSEDEARAYGIELGDEVTFEPYGERTALMEIAKHPRNRTR
jgi:putative aminopeptidase FrvX